MKNRETKIQNIKTMKHTKERARKTSMTRILKALSTNNKFIIQTQKVKNKKAQVNRWILTKLLSFINKNSRKTDKRVYFSWRIISLLLTILQIIITTCLKIMKLSSISDDWVKVYYILYNKFTFT